MTKKKSNKPMASRGQTRGEIAADLPEIPDRGPINCDECGTRLERVRLENFDFSAWAGMPVTLKSVPGYRCKECGGETIPGKVVNVSLWVVAIECIKMPQRLHAQFARYLRRTLEITQQELADRMSIARETVAAWECGEREISPQHDFILRSIVLQRASGDLTTIPPELRSGLLVGALSCLGSVKSEPPPRKAGLGPVETKNLFVAAN